MNAPLSDAQLILRLLLLLVLMALLGIVLWNHPEPHVEVVHLRCTGSLIACQRS